MSPSADRHPAERRKRVYTLLPRTLAPAAYGAALLGGIFAPDRTLHPVTLVLLAAFIAYFGWRIHAVLTRKTPSDLERVEVGLLATLALSTVLEIGAPPQPWSFTAYGVLLVGLAPSISMPGVLALPLAATSLWTQGPSVSVLHLELLAAVAGTVALLEHRRRRRLQLALEKLRLDGEHLASRSSPGPRVPGGDLARLDDVLYAYLREVKDNAGAHGAVLAVRRAGGDLYVRELVSDSHDIREDAILDLHGTTFHWILENRKPLRIAHLRDPADRLGYYRGKVGVKSFLGVPVIERDRVEGVLALDSLSAEAFTDGHLNMLKIASHQVATLLDQIRQLEQVRRESRDFELLHEFSKRLAPCSSVDELLELVLASAHERIPQTSFSAVALVSGDGRVTIKAGSGKDGSTLRGRTFGTGEGLAGWVLSNGHYLHYQEGRERARRPLFGREVKLPEFPSLMIHPLKAADQVFGVFCLGSRDPKAFDSSAVAFCEVLAQQGAQAVERIRMLEQLQDLATRDELTGLQNRRVFFERLAAEIPRSLRYDLGLAILLLDVDHFKRVNDRHGHPAGDEVLRQVAKTLRDHARETDVVARYGGEEFAAMLPATQEEGAQAVAERIRRGIEQLEVHWEETPIPIRASLGLACLRGEDDTVDDLIHRADQALYAAKERGRNRVISHSEIQEYLSWT